MRKFFSFCAFFTALAFLFLSGCASGVPEDTSAEWSDTVPETDSPGFVITAEALGSYFIVRSEEAPDDVVDAVISLRNALANINSDIGIKTDYYKEGFPMFEIGEFEILVGAVEREESIKFQETLKRDDYGYRMVGSKLVISGGNSASTVSAVNRFMREVVKQYSEGDEVFYSESMDYFSPGYYDIMNLTIAGVPVEQYRIVYPERGSLGESDIASMISSRIYEATGYAVKTVSDNLPAEDGVREILVGDTNRYPNSSSSCEPGRSKIVYDGTSIRICGVDSQGLGVAARKLTAPLEEVFSMKSYDLEVSAETTAEYDSSGLSSMSFNVLVSNATAERKARVIQIVRNYMPDTVGFQEVSPDWMTTLTGGLGDVYGYVGQGRDGGTKGEHNPIFYKKSVFNLIESGTRWLSDTPSTVSKYSESSLNRIWTYALLERKSDGTRIMVVNTHFDHKSSVAREKQSLVLSAFLKDYLTYPLIVTGDFNAKSSTTEYSTIIKTGLKDSSYAASPSERVATFTNYGSSNSIIDFVFINPKTIDAKSYRVCNEIINGDYPSDHHPVFVEYSVTG